MCADWPWAVVSGVPPASRVFSFSIRGVVAGLVFEFRPYKTSTMIFLLPKISQQTTGSSGGSYPRPRLCTFRVVHINFVSGFHHISPLRGRRPSRYGYGPVVVGPYLQVGSLEARMLIGRASGMTGMPSSATKNTHPQPRKLASSSFRPPTTQPWMAVRAGTQAISCLATEIQAHDARDGNGACG